jgi:hypothetical protein
MSFRDFTRTLSANVAENFNVAPATSIYVLSGEYPFQLTIDGSSFSMETGVGVELTRQFTDLDIISEYDQTITLMIGIGHIQDNRLVGNVDISGGIKLASFPNSLYGAVTVDSTATLIRAANSARGQLTLQNNGNDIWLGNNVSVTSSNGIKISSGSSVSIKSANSIYGIALTDGQDIRYWEDNLV